MQIKRFEAQNMTEALRLIKQEFGSEAVILSARSLEKKRRVFGFMQEPGVEMTAATDSSYFQVKKNDSLYEIPKMQYDQPKHFDLEDSSRKKNLWSSLRERKKC